MGAGVSSLATSGTITDKFASVEFNTLQTLFVLETITL